MQQWTWRELLYFAKGESERGRQRDLQLLQITYAAQAHESYREMFNKLTAPDTWPI